MITRRILLNFIIFSALILLLAVASCKEAVPTPAPIIIPGPVATLPPSTPTLAPLAPATVLPVPAPALPTSAPATPEALPAPPTAVSGAILEISEPQNESILSLSPVRVRGIATLDTTVSINGRIVEVEDNGSFTATVNLLEGPNFLEIMASDYHGNQDSKIITVIYIP